MGGPGAADSAQRAAARCLHESFSSRASPRKDEASLEQGEARTIPAENPPPRLYTVSPHSLFAILMNLNKSYALYLVLYKAYLTLSDATRLK